MALLSIVGVFFAALLPDTAPTERRQQAERSCPTVCSQPEDGSLVTLVGTLLMTASAQNELEEELESGEETGGDLQALPTSQGGLGGLHYWLLTFQDRWSDSRTIPWRIQAPDPRPPRA